jgi:hypothetical protein
MSQDDNATQDFDPQSLTGERLGPYNSFNPVSRTQVWQWCCAMGDNNPLYLDDEYRASAGYDRVVAPPAMMQMWTMRDINDRYAPGSTDAPPYRVFDILTEQGYPRNVAVSYDITFHHLLLEGDRVHHYHSISAVSDLKKTALGEGFFVTQHAQFLDQDERLFAEAFITYFQYRTADNDASAPEPAAPSPVELPEQRWQTTFSDVRFGELEEGQALPELVIPITHRLVVGGALATQDFVDVHHNAPAARAAGMPDIFMNILTTSGLCARYLSDWAGPASRLRKLRFKLMAPNTPGDTMVMQGRIQTLDDSGERPLVSVDFAGRNGRGVHVAGQAELAVAKT